MRTSNRRSRVSYLLSLRSARLGQTSLRPEDRRLAQPDPLCPLPYPLHCQHCLHYLRPTKEPYNQATSSASAQRSGDCCQCVSALRMYCSTVVVLIKQRYSTYSIGSLVAGASKSLLALQWLYSSGSATLHCYCLFV